MKRNPKTAGGPVRRAFTMIELLVVIAIIAILASLLLPAVVGGIKKADITQAQSEAKLLEAAMAAYFMDYQKYPGQYSGGETEHKYQDYNLLIATLRGSNTPGTVKDSLGLTANNWANQNPRRKIYLQVNDKSIATNGSVNMGYAIAATLGDLSDPWGNRYVVIADWNRDGKVLADGETILRKVAVWSWGPITTGLGIESPTNTAHIRSWRN